MIYINITMNEIDKVVYEAKYKEKWDIIKRGRKYIYLRSKENEYVCAKVRRSKWDTFTIDNIVYEVWITEIEKYMNSTHLYAEGRKDVVRKIIEKLKKKLEGKEYEIEGEIL